MPVERITTCKLLGIHIANDLKWAQHVEVITSKGCIAPLFLEAAEMLRRRHNDLLCFYITAIQPVLV